MAGRTGWAGLLGLALILGTAPASPAAAQMSEEELQRCIWRCLADSPGAASSQYEACTRRECSGDAPAAQPTARSGWGNTGGTSGGQMASVTVGLSTLSYVCERGKPALLAISGLPGPSNGITVQVDNQSFQPPFASRDGVHYTAARAGSALLNALLSGNSVQIRNPGGNSVSSFSLKGSGKAIGTAMSRCGL
ncbi:hypothetical protein [Paracoccus marinaquae]|uniref:Uncharacterized protein n=1 Tax=Paracoccus marinaquae TaxID=2841926 RepID=A0ABS6AGD6_9RHOB|nr:hypothetical protein [Paracoccus marinaquae]MBU3028750.1 hypothetical protein [Paracoccus marinaquae]